MSDSTVQGTNPSPGAPPATAPAKPSLTDKPLYISSSPHIGSPVSSGKLMRRVIIALAPVTIFGIVLYGFPALLTIVVSIVTAVVSESLFRKITNKEPRHRDCSAVVTGLLLALILPPGTPLWITAMGALFAVVVAKEFFGGLGANVFNPALIGRAFILLSFPVAATTWAVPRAFFAADAVSAATAADAVSSATPLGIIKMGGSVADVGIDLASKGLAAGSDYCSTIWSFFLGIRGGCIGESSIVLILIGFVYLLLTKTIDWRTPVSMIFSVLFFSLVFGGDPLFAIVAGGVLFGAVFMATDYVTSPLTASGKLIFGFCAGLITVLIRQWGNYPEGVTYSILIMNAVTPYLNRLLQKKYGYVKPQKPAKAAADKGGTK